MEALVASQVAGGVYCVQSTISSGGGGGQQGEDQQFKGELDLSSYLWSEANLGEVDYKFGETRQTEKPSSLELKAYGYSRQVQDLCSQLDQLLEKLLEDLGSYVDASPPSGGPSSERGLLFLPGDAHAKAEEEPFELCSDSRAVLLFAQDCVVSHVRELLQQVSSKHLKAQSSSSTSRGLMLFLGRFFQAVPELCPALEKCALAPQTLSRREEELVTSVAALQQRRAMASRADPTWAELKGSFENISCEVHM